MMELLQNHEWSGNVRELENTLLQAVVLSNGEVLKAENLLFKRNEISKKGLKQRENWSLDEANKFHIKFILDKVGGNKTQACRILKISKPTLYKKIEEFKL